MPDGFSASRSDLVLANRLLSHEGILDAFGHVSLRHPHDQNRFLLSVALPPDVVEDGDLIAFDLDSRPITATDRPLYSEGVIHGAIYRARPDVTAICHHHAPAIMPYCVSGMPLVPVSQTGCVIGEQAPFWDSQDEFGDTNLLVTKPEEAESLARALGPHWIVLMRRHGATVVGRSLKEMAFRSIYSAANAATQTAAAAHGNVQPLTPGEVAMGRDLKAGAIERSWVYCLSRLKRAGGLPA